MALPSFVLHLASEWHKGTSVKMKSHRRQDDFCLDDIWPVPCRRDGPFERYMHDTSRRVEGEISGRITAEHGNLHGRSEIGMRALLT